MDRQPVRVLLVDNDRDEYTPMRHLLDQVCGRAYVLDRVTAYDEALEAILSGPYEVALVNDRLGDRDGLELAREAAARGGTTPLILLAGRADPELDLAATDAGAADYLVAGECDAGTLERSLRYAVGRGRTEATLREAERFARSVLDWLAARIAVLDGSGTILAVNRAWREFARASGADEAAVCEGSNYLAACDVADGPDADAARLFAAGIRDVLAGRRDRHELEYACQGPTESRWFLARATRMQGDGPPRAVVIHADITQRVAAEQEVRRLNEGLELRLRRIEALRRIDASIASGCELSETLGVVIEQAADQLGVDAAALLLYDETTGAIRHAAGEDFAGRESGRAAGQPDDPASRIAAIGRSVHVADLSRVAEPDALTRHLIEAGFVGYHAVPLAAKGRVKGVLELAVRGPMAPDPEWTDYLATLAGQAAIAIDNAALYEGLPASNARLSLAYDATIEAWARALDMREKESEGHSRRVAEMTLRVARVMGLGEAELVHLRRGALLHDVGKMGVPDAILLKSGPLTDEDTRVMLRHPELAVEMLAPIEFLQPALDIPLCHHERWDGAGYPRGLRGETIPLAARIFAAVDIWDALSHDRPDRRAWGPRQLRDRLRSLAGSHLDPDVVVAFLRILDEEPADGGAPGTIACLSQTILSFFKSLSLNPVPSAPCTPNAGGAAAPAPRPGPEVLEATSEPAAQKERAAPGRQDPPPGERRSTPRTLLRDIEGIMSWRGEQGEITCAVKVLNISGNGAATLADRELRAGQPLRLSLSSKSAKHEPIECQVIETRSDPSGKWVVHVRFAHWVPLGPFLEAHRERRLWERYPVRESRAIVSWQDEATETSIRGDLLNISGGGAAFRGDAVPPTGVPIWLQLEAGLHRSVKIDAIEGRLLMTSYDPSGRRVAHIQFVDPCPQEFFDLAVDGA